MDVVQVASLTAAITTLATEATKTVATEASKDLWTKVKTLFGWTAPPREKELARDVATRLKDDEKLRRELLTILNQHPDAAGANLVGSVQAEKVVVANTIDVKGDFNM